MRRLSILMLVLALAVVGCDSEKNGAGDGAGGAAGTTDTGTTDTGTTDTGTTGAEDGT